MLSVQELWSTFKYYAYLLIYGTYFKYIIYIKTYKVRKSFETLNSEDTINDILKNNSSICRFGDGELRMIAYYLEHGDANKYNIDTFQRYSADLGKRLLEVLMSDYSDCLICMPYVFSNYSVYRGYEKLHWEREYCYYQDLLAYIAQNRKRMKFGDSCFTRFYFHRTDIRDYSKYIHNLKKIWDNEDIVFLEGDKSRLGVGNDLFDNAKSIKRFLLPTTNAFSKYDEILNAVKQLPKDKLYLLALGHTATVLAYDMYKLGFRAMDIGHVDIEYEWLRMGAKQKVAVPNKYVNEVNDGRIKTEYEDPIYLSQVIGKIG